MDGLSYLVPHKDPDYAAARPDIAVPSAEVLPLDDTFGLHPAAEPLSKLWDDGQLVLIPASGSTDMSRSHFDASAVVEAGLGENRHHESGWLGRFVESTSSGTEIEAVAIGRIVPLTLLGSRRAIGLADLATYRLGPIGSGEARGALTDAIRTVYPDPPADLIGSQGLASFGVLDRLARAGLTGQPVPEAFGTAQVGADLWQAAQLIGAGLGPRAITVYWGGWDHHADLGTPTAGRMREQLDALATAVRAFWDTVSSHHDDVTVLIVSEFGRRVAQNTNGGTDHGHGGVMTVLGSGLTGGILGEWAGLGPDVLDRGDVPVLIDYRHVLAEIIDRRVGAPASVAEVFPDFETGPSSYVGLVG